MGLASQAKKTKKKHSHALSSKGERREKGTAPNPLPIENVETCKALPSQLLAGGAGRMPVPSGLQKSIHWRRVCRPSTCPMPSSSFRVSYARRLEARMGTHLEAPAWPRVHIEQVLAAMLVPGLQHGRQVVEPVPRA